MLPGVTEAMIMRRTESPLSAVLTTFPSLMLLVPFSVILFAFSCSSLRSFARSVAFISQLLDSTFAMVIRPKTMGRVMVGSGCARVVKVKKDSESKGVGSCDSLLRMMVKPINTGSWDSGGSIIVLRGPHLCFWRSFFRNAVKSASHLLAWYCLRYSLSPRMPVLFISSKTSFATMGFILPTSGITTS